MPPVAFSLTIRAIVSFREGIAKIKESIDKMDSLILRFFSVVKNQGLEKKIHFHFYSFCFQANKRRTEKTLFDSSSFEVLFMDYNQLQEISPHLLFSEPP